jgi:hypothetical protein
MFQKCRETRARKYSLAGFTINWSEYGKLFADGMIFGTGNIDAKVMRI